MNKLAIITPIFNRAYIVDKLYESLKNQIVKNFTWYLVDDGSTDNIQDKVAIYLFENEFEIKFYSKENGGKHRAINYVLQHVNEEFVLIVDSDDYLSHDAVKTFYDDLYIFDNDKVSAISYLRAHPNNEIIGKKHKLNEKIGNLIKDRLNYGDLNDKAEIYRKKCLLEYPFIEIPNEKFLFEDYSWLQIAAKYDMYFKDKIIYYCDYLSDGLTKNALKQKFSSPQGMLYRSILWMNKRMRFKYNLRGLILYQIYKKVIKNKKQTPLVSLKDGKGIRVLIFLLYPLTIPVSLYLYIRWKKTIDVIGG